jgi:hypothetical protein
LVQLVELGRFDDASPEASAVLEWATQANHAFAIAAALTAVAGLEIHRGGSSVDVEQLAELLRDTSGPRALAIAARLARARGDEERARQFLAAATGDARQPALATLAIDLGLPELAEEILAREGHDTPVAAAEREMADAGLAEVRKQTVVALEHYQSAVLMHEGLQMPIGQARALQAMGRMLLTSGDSEAGTRHLSEARDLWTGIGAIKRIAEIDELLATHELNVLDPAKPEPPRP